MPITVRIAGDNVTYGYQPYVTQAGGNSLDVRSYVYSGMFPIVKTSTLKYSLNEGLAAIPAADLPLNDKFLVFYSCSHGMRNDDNFSNVRSRCYAFQGTGSGTDREFALSSTHSVMTPGTNPYH